MKNIQLKGILTFFLLCFVLSGCEKKSTDLFPYEEEVLMNVEEPDIIDEYIYPVRPGTEAWSNLRTETERFNAMQLPDSILQSISTWGLIRTCFNLPAYGYWGAFDDYSGAVNGLFARFNGFTELFSREDLIGKLLFTYRHLDFNELDNPIKYSWAELIIGSDKFISFLDKKQRIYLVSVALYKYKLECKNPEISMQSAIYIMGNVMFNDGYKPFTDYCALKKEYAYGGFASKFNSPYDKIEEYAKKYIDY